ncbi:hypothetical protein PRK78_002276 [Emydomyces testavorans]|uniref:Uncharacterized protein n=1 Tax=Emydomyces testavorans TaxID=2070801 RepID=A0AAF0DDU4_9EURO|nr:hypothetical protein PRK78_002276 [Emydomyces testavorans]
MESATSMAADADREPTPESTVAGAKKLSTLAMAVHMTTTTNATEMVNAATTDMPDTAKSTRLTRLAHASTRSHRRIDSKHPDLPR